MATPQEQQLEISKQNLAAAQAAPNKTAADISRVTQLEKSVAYLQERVNLENSANNSFSVTTTDGTIEKYNSKGELIESIPPAKSSDQKTVSSTESSSTTASDGSSQIEGQATPSDNYYENTFGGATETEQTALTAALAERRQTTSNTISTKAAVAENDWRVRLSLAPKANYLYMAENMSKTNILAPLRSTSGVLFPYMPTISVSYRANYDPTEVAHSNYRLQFYKGSSVDDIQITAEFTAQDTNEAKYLLAVIHFFRSVTKMFYGQDSNPRGGTPPPLCYLSGLGAYQFNKHPLVISSFQYTLPTDVDYIRTEAITDWEGSGMITAEDTSPKKSTNIFQRIRLKMAGAPPNAKPPSPTFKNLSSISEENSYVPTKMQITLGAHVIVTRSDVSKTFSLEKYASGELIKKGFW
jgi:hypothetical protein